MPLSWPFDLQLGLIRLMGMLCGATLNANPGMYCIYPIKSPRGVSFYKGAELKA